MTAARPPSATDFRINLVGLAAMLLATAVICWTKLDERWAVPILMAAAAAPILLLDTVWSRVYRRASTGIDWSKPHSRDLGRIATRYLGALGAMAPVALFYWLTPEYQGDFYDRFWDFLRWFGPIGLVVGALYFAWIDPYQADPKDSYWHVGRLLLGRGDWERDKVGQALRGFAIKGFFVPLMFIYASRNVVDLQRAVSTDREAFLYAFEVLWHLGFLVDVTFTTMGYLATFRLFDTQVRSAEPTMTGWVAAMVCYQPFWSIIGTQYLAYEGGYRWGEWLAPWPMLIIPWGIAIILCNAVFSGSTVAFGCRFSNLTHRGVVTSGPYSWTRHPAYVAKLASYWLINIPFVFHGSWYEVIRDCTWLSALGGVYWLRARTEERHLSVDPDYVRYALWMNTHSWFAPVGRWFPFLAYRAPSP